MANYKDTLNIPIAITDSTPLDLSSKHITTANWMQLNPVYVKEMVPGESLHVGVESFTRLNPLVVPTFAPGSKLKTSRFFVPFRTIFRGWNDFITDTVHVNSNGDYDTADIINVVPIITNNTLYSTLTQYVFDLPEVDAPYKAKRFAYIVEDGPYDLVDVNTGDKYQFTPAGRQALKILESLGYKVLPDFNDNEKYSALPLLAYAKVYADYYWPSAYMDSMAHKYLESCFNRDLQTDYVLGPTTVGRILLCSMFCCYDSDYFTSAFDNPVAASTGVYSRLSLRDYSLPRPFNMNYSATGTVVANRAGQVLNYNDSMSTGTTTAVTPSNGTPYFGPAKANSLTSNPRFVNFPVLTQYADSMLHRLTDYVKRHQLAGSRALERYMARFGKSLSAEKLNRCVYVGTDVTTIQIGDVMSTSDTFVADSGSVLGAYAGKGAAYSKNDYDSFDTDEYGIYMIISSLVPDIFYDQGVDASIKHIYKTEFWTPEFDYGMRAITADELLVPMTGGEYYCPGAPASANTSNPVHNQVFGFTPRYAEYRVGKSRLTGDFRINSLNANDSLGSASWHMERMFDPGSFGGSYSGCVHSPSFVMGINDAGQFNRIFYNNDYEAPDQFVTIYNFDVKSYSPMPSLYENYDWCDDQSGRNITMQANGVKVN